MTNTDVNNRCAFVQDVAKMARRLLLQLDGLDQRLSEMQVYRVERKK